MFENRKIYFCEKCDYTTNIKCNFEKHELSIKHYNKTINVNKINDKPVSTTLKCVFCNKRFNHRSTLWSHKKKCIKKNDNNYDYYLEDDSEDYLEDDSESDEDFDNDFEKELDRKFNGVENITMLQIMQQMCEQNMQLKEQLQEQHKEFQEQQQKTTEIMMELVKTNNNNSSINNIAINSNNTSNTNNFNLNFFLNETCKDAMSIDDFLDSIEITITDLKRLGKEGYVEALSTLLIDNLKEMDITKRPMHCSDLKRETIYIKDLYGWEKENSHKARLTKVLNEITRLNTIALQGIYQKAYPHCLTDHKSKEHKEYGEIVYNAFGGKGDIEKLNRIIIHNLVKEIVIRK